MSRISLFKGSNNLSFLSPLFKKFSPKLQKENMQTDFELKVRQRKKSCCKVISNLRSGTVETQKKCTLSTMVLSYKLINPERLCN